MKGEPLSSVLEQAVETPMVGKSVITLDDLSIRQIQELLHKAQYIDSHRKEVAHTCDGRVLATLFYEPSTRTRLSFETAMLRLGGKVIGFAGAQLASVTKGETISDTLKTVSNYVDVVAIRHPKEGAALVASRAASVPVINAGDGGHMHPTQTLADLATMQSRFGRVNNLTVGLCGDLTFGRTVHSLIETLCRFGNVNFVLISPDELKTPQYVLDRINATDSCSYTEVKDLVSVIGDLDVLYMTRVQKERFFNEDDYLRLRDTYILDEAKMAYAKKDMAVLHPLPRVNEIAVEVDDDPRAAYFEQVKNGMMAVDEAVIELGVRVLRIEAFAEPLFGASIVASGVFQGTGSTLVPMLLNFGTMWGIRVPLSAILAAKWGLVGVWVAMALQLGVCGICFLIRLAGKRWLPKETLQ